VREDIKTSNCTNLNYLPDGGDTNPCYVIDDRVGVNVNCSEECSLKQFGYFYCKYLGEELANIDRECGETVVGAGDCSFNDDNFCVLYPSSNYQTVYDKCFVESNVSDGSCSDECKEALDDFTDALGCCVTLLLDLNQLSANLFSTCGVRVPGVCNSFSPPRKFLDCAHDGDVHATPTVFLSIILIMVSLFNLQS
jgi:hypothetical protein